MSLIGIVDGVLFLPGTTRSFWFWDWIQIDLIILSCYWLYVICMNYTSQNWCSFILTIDQSSYFLIRRTSQKCCITWHVQFIWQINFHEILQNEIGTKAYYQWILKVQWPPGPNPKFFWSVINRFIWILHVGFTKTIRSYSPSNTLVVITIRCMQMGEMVQIKKQRIQFGYKEEISRWISVEAIINWSLRQRLSLIKDGFVCIEIDHWNSDFHWEYFNMCDYHSGWFYMCRNHWDENGLWDKQTYRHE